MCDYHLVHQFGYSEMNNLKFILNKTCILTLLVTWNLIEIKCYLH